MEKSRPYPERYKRHKEFLDDKTLYACPSCRCGWEFVKRPPRFEIYEDFPTLGLPKKLCAECLKKR